MPQTSSVSIVILRHSGQLCRCIFGGEQDVLISEMSQSGIILAFISTMSLNRSADLTGQDGANAITVESNVNAKAGGNSYSDKCLDCGGFQEKFAISTTVTGIQIATLATPRIRSCYSLVGGDSLMRAGSKLTPERSPSR